MKFFKRHLYQQLINQLDDKEYIIIAGARQTGKSTLLRQLSGFLQERNEKTAFINLEDFAILSKLNEHPENLFLFTPKPGPDEKKYLLIDEIQYLSNPTNFLKLIFDTYSDSIKIIATGSSAFYIDTKFKDSLAGRKQLFWLPTLNFEEFLLFKTKNTELSEELQLIRNSENYLSLRRQELSGYFDEFLTYGGYPAVVLAQGHENKTALLKDLLNSFTRRDIEEANIRHPEKFYQLMLLLAEQTGNLMNVNELANTLGLSTTSVNNYVYVLQKCFHISLLKPFYSNLRKELSKMPKIYYNDLGLRNILLKQFVLPETRLDKGALLENYLFLRLQARYTPDKLRFWRTASGKEVDFVVLDRPNKEFAIESKFRSTAFKPAQYKTFTATYPQIPLYLKTYSDKTNANWALTL